MKVSFNPLSSANYNTAKKSMKQSPAVSSKIELQSGLPKSPLGHHNYCSNISFKGRFKYLRPENFPKFNDLHAFMKLDDFNTQTSFHEMYRDPEKMAKIIERYKDHKPEFFEGMEMKDFFGDNAFYDTAKFGSADCLKMILDMYGEEDFDRLHAALTSKSDFKKTAFISIARDSKKLKAVAEKYKGHGDKFREAMNMSQYTSYSYIPTTPLNEVVLDNNFACLNIIHSMMAE